MSRWAIAFQLILFLLSGGAAWAESDVIARVEVGFSGSYKAGLWTPVRVHFSTAADLDGAELSLIVPDGDGVPSRVSAPLPSPAPESVLLYARFGRIHCPLTVRLDRSGTLISERNFEPGDALTQETIPPALRSNQRLVVEVGRASLGIGDAIAQMREREEEETTLATLDHAAELPDHWYGYEGVSLVVLSGTDLECYAGLGPEDVRIRELAKWVRRGGRLMIAVGEHGEALLGPDGPLRSLLPGKFSKIVPLPQARELETFSGSRVSLPGRVNDKTLQVAQLTDVQGMVSARKGDLPLVVYRVWGFGQVIFLASDLDRGPLGKWAGRPQFVAKLFGWPVKPIEYEEEDKTIRHYGYTDLAGQLRSALDQFEGVWQIPFGLIAGAVVLYLLLIGPGDYYLLRKFLGRMELTWVTFPATIILFCALAYFVAHSTKGDRFLVNQATLVDVDVETGELRGTAWANVYSPETRRVGVRFSAKGLDNDSACSEFVTAWLGLPGKALGSMDPMTPPPPVWREPYSIDLDRSQLADVPIQVWSSKSLTTRWSGHADSTFQCQLEQKGPVPAGTLTNKLDVTLADCLLIYRGWVYELGTLAPGQPFRVGPTVPRRELASFLTGRKLVFDKEESRARQQTTRYSVESTDAEYILRAMTFFRAAGGRPYTHLSNSYQGFVDMSDLLLRNRAVLVAKVADSDAAANLAPRGAAQIALASNGQDVPLREKHTTLLRFVLPVTPDER